MRYIVRLIRSRTRVCCNIRLVGSLYLASDGQLRVYMAGLCYDTQPVEAMPFPVAMADKIPYALSSDSSQEKFPQHPRRGRFIRRSCNELTGRMDEVCT
jgi:hypothetical protein